MPNNAPPITHANTIAAVVNVLMGYGSTNQASPAEAQSEDRAVQDQVAITSVSATIVGIVDRQGAAAKKKPRRGTGASQRSKSLTRPAKLGWRGRDAGREDQTLCWVGSFPKRPHLSRAAALACPPTGKASPSCAPQARTASSAAVNQKRSPGGGWRPGLLSVLEDSQQSGRGDPLAAWPSARSQSAPTPRSPWRQHRR